VCVVLQRTRQRRDIAYASPTVAVSGDGTCNTPAPQFVPTQAGDPLGRRVQRQPAEHQQQDHSAACADAATISAPAGTGNLAGKVCFTLYPTNNCTGTAIYSTPTA
jgi:hypothetical protein